MHKKLLELDDHLKFSIQDAKFETVFGDFAERQAKRKSDDWKYRFKVPTTIDEIDYRLGGENGGPETGECVLWLGDSGAGKSQVLVHVGVSAARQGFRVAHFQLEGTKEQCLNRYDAAWTGTLYQVLHLGKENNSRQTIIILKEDFYGVLLILLYTFIKVLNVQLVILRMSVRNF